MIGSFQIVCDINAQDQTIVRERRVRAPFHLSKPHTDNNVLVVQSVNSTAGVFSGDCLEMDVEVRPSASVLLTAPAAHIVYAMPDGSAELTQRFTVRAGGWLELMPELFIPQRHSAYRQSTSVHLEHGATFYGMETLTPGRVASGESFSWRSIDWETDLYLDSVLAARERYRLEPAGDRSTGFLNLFNTPYYASISIVSDKDAEVGNLQSEVHKLGDSGTLCGMSRLQEGVFAIRIVTGSSLFLRQALNDIRVLFADVFPKLHTNARKL